jgi:hypothetical protein
MFCFILKLLVLDNWDAGNQALESWSICVVVLYFPFKSNQIVDNANKDWKDLG